MGALVDEDRDVVGDKQCHDAGQARTRDRGEGVLAPDQLVGEGCQPCNGGHQAEDEERSRKDPSPDLLVVAGHESVDSVQRYLQPHRRPLGPAALRRLGAGIEPLANVDPDIAWCIGQEAGLAQGGHEVAHLLETECSEPLEVVDDEVRDSAGAVHPLDQKIVPFANPEVLSGAVGEHDVRITVAGCHPRPGEVAPQDRHVAAKAHVLSEAVPH